MQKNTVLIIEDDILIATHLKTILEKNEYQVIGIADNGPDALTIAKENKIDLVLADINILPPWTGIDTVSRILKIQNPLILFLTVYDENNIVEEAQKLNPSGYILKPFQENQLLVSLKIALDSKKTNVSDTEIENENGNSVFLTNDSLFFKELGVFNRIDFSDINYFESKGRYVELHYSKGVVLLKISINKLEKIIPKTFFYQCHRSYIVNFKKTDSFSSEFIIIQKSLIPISKANYKEFLNIVLNNPKF